MFWCRMMGGAFILSYWNRVADMLSQTAEYALRAVACMAAREGAAVPADKVAEETKVPRRYLARVLQDLVAHGLVVSRPGPGGGYELAMSPAKITILDVINIVDPIQRINRCPLGLRSHHKLCPLHAELDKAYAKTEAAFAKVTIRQLLNSTNSVVPLCEQ